MTIRSLRSIVAGQTPTTTSRAATVFEAAQQMKASGKGALLVLDGSKLVGIFTERDALYRVVAAGLDPKQVAVGDVMTPQPQSIHPDEPFVNALRAMHRGGYRHLPVVEHGRPLGVVSSRDALDHDLTEFQMDLEQRESERD